MLSSFLAKFINEMDYESLPETTITKAKNSIIDWMGVTAAGYMRPSTRHALQLSGEEGSAPVSSLIGTGKQTSPMWGALINGISSHAVDMDDLHRKTSLHPGSAIIPAALSIAEKRGCSGKELILAVVLGYDIAIRIAEAVIPSHNDHWYSTGTCGTFGAAVAAGRIAGLNEEQVVNALGNAGMQASGLYEISTGRTMSKQLNAGKASMDGLLAVLLAEKGFAGPEQILEGPNGFFSTFSTKPEEKILEEELGQYFKISETSFKLYPSARHTHAAVDLALRLMDRGITEDNIELVRIKTYKLAKETLSNLMPELVEEAKHSMPYCVAATFVSGLPKLETFAEERINNPKIQSVMSHCTVEVDPELDMRHPDYWPITMEIIDNKSHIIREHTDFPKGDPENPVAPAELQDKFRGLFGKMVSPERADELLNGLLDLENVKNVKELNLYK